ncbi:hypothetical protein FSP39_010143 [Pinctada imbricata]|uniref:Neurotransmitter-gated ion-channel ligand-binding domain-containing protein n=1 Tax=Pinctada imbricata TaxID=66713 RepID=A0AA88YQM6_PINIB|nr:hypothetical protein FSP39_010143 [Pinctada imbricata]
MTVLNRGYSSFMKEGFSQGQIRVYSNGTIRASHSGLLDIVCTTDARQFPFDEQDCTILMQSGSYTNSEVTLTFSQAEVIYYSYKDDDGHPIWNVKRITTEILTSYYRSDVAFISFHLQRKSLYYACTMITPSAILSLLTMIAFFIPNDSGEKLSCGLALFLSFVVFLIQIGDIVPENSNGNSVIGNEFYFCVIENRATKVKYSLNNECIMYLNNFNNPMS